jgi:hypothetical protein
MNLDLAADCGWFECGTRRKFMSESSEKSGELVTAAIDSDSELNAIRLVLSALVPLKQEGRTRVLDYVLGRLGMAEPVVQQPFTTGIGADAVLRKSVDVSDSLSLSANRPTDIRSLTKQKAPRSANEMAALVAYYLSELAPEPYRKATIGAEDIKAYFKQAPFKLPQSAQQTLVNAKNSGYLESAGTGQYKLNPVGYNLVVHSLPAASSTKKRGKPRKPNTKKSSRKGR